MSYSQILLKNRSPHLDRHESLEKGMEGRLELRCERRAGCSVLGHQYFTAPYHVSKAYWSGEVLLVQVTNPTAGIFSGDKMISSVSVQENAALLLTSPSAQRVYTMNGGQAIQDIHFQVKKNAWLEVYPELFVPQKNSIYQQHSSIDIESGGEVYFAEIIAPGRLAFGENLDYLKLSWSCRIKLDQEILSIERCEIEPAKNQWMLKVSNWEQTFYFTIWLISPDLPLPNDALYKSLDDFHGDDLYLGYSHYQGKALVIKGMGSSSLLVRKTMRDIRNLFSKILPKLQTNPRKL